MTQQIETATVLGTITLSGDAVVTVTAAGMTNSPKAISVAVLNLDSAATVALKTRQTLALDTDVQASFLVGGLGADIVLTARIEATNDATLNIAIDNDTCTGLTAAPTSTDTQDGSLSVINAYASLAQYKAWIAVRGLLGVVTPDTSDDSVIAILLEGASRFMERETGRRFDADVNDVTRYYTPTDPQCVRIDDLSAAPTTVSVDYTGGTRSYTDLAVTQYDMTPDNALLKGQPYTQIELNPFYTTNLPVFPTIRRAVKVIGKWGYPSIPTDITDAVLSIAQNVNGIRSGQSSSGRITVTQAGIVIRPEEVPAYAQRIINHYRSRI